MVQLNDDSEFKIKSEIIIDFLKKTKGCKFKKPWNP